MTTRNRITRGRILVAVSVTSTLLVTGVAFSATVTKTKSSLPARTSGDVSTLTARENAVATQLRAFSHLGKKVSVTQWEKQLKADESAELSAESTLNSDLATKPKSTTSTGKTQKGVYAMGAKVTTPVTIEGIVSATVFGFYPNITSSQPDVDQPPSGKTYAAIDAQECAGSSASSSGASESDFTILLSNGSTAGNPDSLGGNPTVAPLSSESELGSGSQSLSAHQCDRGWVVFDIPKGVTPTYVQFTGTTASFTQANTVAKWKITG